MTGPKVVNPCRTDNRSGHSPFYDPSTCNDEDGDWQPVPGSVTAILLSLAGMTTVCVGWLAWHWARTRGWL